MFIEKLIKDGKVDGTWFEDWWNKELDDRKVAARSSKALEQKTNKELDPQKTINDLVFQALGSTENRADFVLCDSEINTYKMRTWKKHRYMNPQKFAEILDQFKRGGESSSAILSIFRVVRKKSHHSCPWFHRQ